MVDVDAFVSLGREPIPGDSPTGGSARYETEFDELSTEIAKLQSVTQERVEWRRVAELCEVLLRDKSKDLLVASYGAFALYDQHGWRGLAAGCTVCRELLDTFWDDLFPEKRRLRARTAALDWLSERLENAVPAAPDPGEADREPLEASVEALVSMRDSESFGSDGPTLGPAIRALRAKLDLIPQPEPEPEPEPEPAPVAEPEPVVVEEAPPPPPEPEPEPEPEPDTPETVRAALEQVRAQQIEYARVLRREVVEPAGYLLLREALWSSVGPFEAGASVDTPLGEASTLSAFATQLEAGDEQEVLAAIEEMLPQFPLWLDLQRVAVCAAEALGRKFGRVTKALEDAATFLLHRHPELVEACGPDERPLADAATRVWIRNELLRDPAAGADPEAAAGRRAREMVARGDLGDAIRFLTGRIDATASRRGRFRLRLDLARLGIESGRKELAVPQLEQLEQEVTQFAVEDWEPDLVTEVVRLLWECCAGKDPAPTLAERSKEIYARLCRLDPAAAVSFDAR